MQVPLGWLKEFIHHDYDGEELAKILTSIGLEAEVFTPEPLNFSRVYVGKVISRSKSADGKGFVYAIDVGNACQGSSVSVFSTIPDLEIGKKYPVALSGGRVGALEIHDREYKGFVSQGKFCASTELGLTKLDFKEHADGTVGWVDNLADENGRALSIFPDLEELEVGVDLAKWLLSDPIVTIELTSNRADCHSMLGVSREMRVITGGEIVLPRCYTSFEEIYDKSDDITIRIDDPAGCMLYAGLFIDKIRVAPSPLWLAKKLFSAGMRPISNIVDITNLVLYEFGQPLHAFDYKLLKDATIIVRRARDGESMATIDGIVRNFIPSDLLIADSVEPVAIAGVMGGYASEVTGQTRQVLLESAWFDPISIRRTSRRLALRTDAAIRFERGVDPNGIIRAVHRVAHLVKELKCGVPAPEVVVARAREDKEIIIPLDENKVTNLLGEEIPTGRIEMILEGLGFIIDGIAPKWKIHVPSFRRDIHCAEDVIEEVARHVGYDNLPTGFPVTHMRSGLLDEDIHHRRKIKDILAGLGLWELQSFPLGTEKRVGYVNPLLPDATPACLTNPISDDTSALRISLIPCVIDTYIRNLRRGAEIHDVFEIGNVYWKDKDGFHERKEVIIGVLGVRAGKKRERTREKGFLRLKGYVESFLDSLRVREYDIVQDNPTKSYGMRHLILRNGDMFGVMETVLEEYLDGETFDRPIFTAIFPWEAVRKVYVESWVMRQFKALPNFPAVERDLAFVLDESVAYRRMVDAIREAGGEHLERIELFDIYRGKQVGEGKKNIAVSLRFRHSERTLTDDEVDEWMNQIVNLVKERTSGKLRDW